ncbi:aquaporin [Peniophora sp. CONT]|nr:aquaporin [Peniophora sp. CONT]
MDTATIASTSSGKTVVAHDHEHVHDTEQGYRKERYVVDAEVPELLHFELDSKPHGYYARYPNGWSRVREYIREPAAEALGTFILCLVGVGVNLQVGLSSNTAVAPSARGDYLSNSFGWALGAACGVWISGGVSGGHINPVVTLSMAIFRSFPWRKVPIYVFAQVLGAFLGSLVAYGNYFHAIDLVEGSGIRTVPGTASLFTSYALDYVSDLNCFFQEAICSFILLLVVFAVTDRNNGPPPSGLVPLAIFSAMFVIIAGFGLQTSFAINPARDLGVRIMTALVGYGEPVWSYRKQFWLWCCICGPLAGGLTAAFVYEALISTGEDSLLNRVELRVNGHEHKRLPANAR